MIIKFFLSPAFYFHVILQGLLQQSETFQGRDNQVPQPLPGHVLQQSDLKHPLPSLLSCDSLRPYLNLVSEGKGSCTNVLEDSSLLASPSTTLSSSEIAPNPLYHHFSAKPESIQPVLIKVNLII